MLRKILAAAVALPLAAAPLAAQTGTPLEPTRDTEATRVGTRGANFLNLPVGAREQALAGAATASTSGFAALYWNGAAIAFDERTQFGASLSNLYDDLDISQIFAGFILPFGDNRVALSVNQLSSGDITRTNPEFPDGGDPQFGQTFEWTSTAIGLHYARLITERFGLGFAAKFISEGISGARADFFAADVSVQFETGILATTVAASLVNVGSQGRVDGALVRRRVEQANQNESTNVFDTRRVLDVGLITREVELPTAFHFGIATQVIGGSAALLQPSADHSLVTMVDMTDATESPLSPTIGVEYGFRDLAFLRVGKRWLGEDQISRDFSHMLSFGGGVSIPLPGERRAIFDYAFTNMGDLENVQAFALEFAF